MLWVSAVASSAHALTPVAKITGFEGEVVLLSGKVFKDIRVGRILHHDDWIQTEKGEVVIEFNDGAVLKVREYSSIVIRERMEQPDSGSRTKRLVRRISCFVGALIFKRGKKKDDNYLQAPLSLAGVRGTQLGVGAPDEVTIDWESGPVGDIFGDIKVGAVPSPAREIWAASPCVRALLKAFRIPVSRNIIGAKIVAYETLLGNTFISKDERIDLNRLLKKLQSIESMPHHVNIRFLDLDQTRSRIEKNHEHIKSTKNDIHTLNERLDSDLLTGAELEEIQYELNNQYIWLNFLTEEIDLLELHEIELQGSRSCFAGETMVITENGALKRIEEVREGDVIMAYDIGEDRRVGRKVTETYKGMVDHYYLVNNELRVARGERFLTPDGWKRVEFLKAGDKISNGKDEETVLSIVMIKKNLRVYNLGVKDSHTFFITQVKGRPLVVHNDAGGGK
jgi:hypothetical protein